MFEKYKSMGRKLLIRRILAAVLGNILIGAGIAFLKTAAFGNDPHSAMMLAIAGHTGSTFGVCYFIACIVYFIVEWVFSRDLVGIGTFVNWFLTGYFTDFFLDLMTEHAPAPGFLFRILFFGIGLLVVSLGISLYQTSDIGVGPYDALAVILDRKLPLPYFWCRIMLDGTCALFAILMGSFGTLVGVGTLVTAFGLGPFISFYNRTVSEKLLNRE